MEIHVVKIIDAVYTGNFCIKIQFSDGTEKNVNFNAFLEKQNHPALKKYLDEKIFAGFRIQNGNLNWNDFDLIFPLSELYEGEIKV